MPFVTDAWCTNGSHLAPSTFVVLRAIHCSLFKIPTVNLKPERQSAVVPGHIERTTLTSGHGNHDNNDGSLWIVDR